MVCAQGESGRRALLKHKYTHAEIEKVRLHTVLQRQEVESLCTRPEPQSLLLPCEHPSMCKRFVARIACGRAVQHAIVLLAHAHA